MKLLHARRCRRLLAHARDIAMFRGEASALAPTFYAALIGLAYAATQAGRFGFYLPPTMALFAALILIALFDARYFVIPDGPVYVLAIIGVATILLSNPEQAFARFAAMAFAYGALWSVGVGYQRLRGAAGLGLGDARLFAIAGLWLGFDGLAACLLYAVVSALLSAALAQRADALPDARTPIPFGPHLALGFWLCWVVGPVQFG